MLNTGVMFFFLLLSIKYKLAGVYSKFLECHVNLLLWLIRLSPIDACSSCLAVVVAVSVVSFLVCWPLPIAHSVSFARSCVCSLSELCSRSLSLLLSGAVLAVGSAVATVAAFLSVAFAVSVVARLSLGLSLAATFGYIRNVLCFLQLVAFETLSSFVMLAKYFNKTTLNQHFKCVCVWQLQQNQFKYIFT